MYHTICHNSVMYVLAEFCYSAHRRELNTYKFTSNYIMTVWKCAYISGKLAAEIAKCPIVLSQQ